MKTSLTSLCFNTQKQAIIVSSNLYNQIVDRIEINPVFSELKNLTEDLLAKNLSSIHDIYSKNCTQVFSTKITFCGPFSGDTAITVISDVLTPEMVKTNNVTTLLVAAKKALTKEIDRLMPHGLGRWYFDPIFVHIEHNCGHYYSGDYPGSGDWSETTDVRHDFYVIGQKLRNQFMEIIENDFDAKESEEAHKITERMMNAE